jgi:hypothetical protein
MKTRIVLPVVAVIGLASCQTWAPGYSEVSGTRYNVTDFKQYSTVINAIDERNPGPRIGYGRYSYYRVEPGSHVIELSAANTTPNWVSGINREYLKLQVEPCKRYYVVAQFENTLTADWKPVVDYVEPIAGCGGGAGY